MATGIGEGTGRFPVKTISPRPFPRHLLDDSPSADLVQITRPVHVIAQQEVNIMLYWIIKSTKRRKNGLSYHLTNQSIVSL